MVGERQRYFGQKRPGYRSPIDLDVFGKEFQKKIKAGGPPKLYPAQGLSEAAARCPTGTECPAPNIAAVTGHKSHREVERKFKGSENMGFTATMTS